MKNSFKPGFEKFSKKLPPDIREKAKRAFKNFEESDQADFSRGLEFKRIKGSKTLHSIRIDDNYRALGHKRERTCSPVGRMALNPSPKPVFSDHRTFEKRVCANPHSAVIFGN